MANSEVPGHRAPLSNWVPTRKNAFQAVLWYVVLAAIWLIGADWSAGHFAGDHGVRETVDLVEDVLFVGMTAVLLVVLQERNFRKTQRSWTQLQEDETRLRLVGDHLPDSYIYQYTRDATGKPRLLHISAGVKQVHGLAVETVMEDANYMFQQMNPEQLPRYVAAEGDSARTLKDFEMELRFRRADGQMRLIHMRSRPRLQGNRQIIWDGFATDITERRRLEMDWDASLARYRSLFDNMLNGFAHCRMIFDRDEPADFLYLDVNPAFKRLTGLNNVIGRLASDVIPGIRSTDGKLLELYGRVAMTGESKKIEIYSEGLKNWVDLSVYSPAKEHFVVIFEIVTDRKRAEAALSERERQLRLFIEHSPAAVSMLDEDMRYLVVSHRWLSDYKLADQNIIGRNHYDVFPDMPERWKEIHRRCLTGAIETNEADAFPRADGRQEWVRWEVRPWRRSDETVGGIIIFSELITARVKAEQALREKERLLQSIINLVPHPIFAKDCNSRYLLANDACAAFRGLKPEQMIGRSDLELLHERSEAEMFMRDDQEVIDSGRRMFIPEELLTNVSGEVTILQTIKMPVELPDVGPSILGVSVDVTELKRAESQLRQSEEEFRTMFESASIGMGQADPRNGRFVRVNKKMCDITGYSECELLKLKILDITHPDDRDADNDLFCSVVRGEIPTYRIEKRYVRKDRKVVWVSVNMNIIRDGASQPLRTMATIEDITSRRMAEEERTRLITALEQAAESVVITDLRGMIVYVNPSFERVSGYSRREALARNPRFLQSGKQDAAFYKDLWNTIKRGQVWRGRFTNKRKDGTLFDEEATISPVRDASGKIVNYVAIKLDVTRERELEGQFRQAQKLEAIGLLAGGVAHDFNNILTSIQIQVELGCMESGVSDECCESFQQIRKDADRAASLTRQLLLFSRRQVMQARDLNLNEAMAHLAKMLQRIIGEDVRMQLNLHPMPLMTHADPGMLDQVVLNLAVNARDAMPDGGKLFIETSELILDEEAALRQAEAAPGQYVCLSVTDTGCGIPPQIMPRIFDPFFTTKEAGKGTGLGLATVFGIVKQHRGWITVESKVGQGSTFKIYFPAITMAPQQVETEIRTKPKGGSEIILLVEDEATLRQSIKTILTCNGYKVLEAASGEEALAVWMENRAIVELLFTDMVMPGGITGQQLARQLQADKAGLKVIYTSGYSADIAGREIQLQDRENFMPKPFNPEALLKMVRSCLDS